MLPVTENDLDTYDHVMNPTKEEQRQWKVGKNLPSPAASLHPINKNKKIVTMWCLQKRQAPATDVSYARAVENWYLYSESFSNRCRYDAVNFSFQSEDGNPKNL